MFHRYSGRVAVRALALVSVLSACGSGGGASTAAPGGSPLTVSVQNSVLPVGVDRLAVALNDGRVPVLGATVSVVLTDGGRTPPATRTLQFIGPGYGQIPVYLGAAAFPHTGAWHLAVHAVLTGGTARDGSADVMAVDHSSELPIGHRVTEAADLRQKTAADVGGDLAKIDSGIADGRSDPDPWHDSTIQAGVDAHRPMVLYFGEPGYCASETCGPTVKVLRRLAATYGDRLLFEHIEVKSPPGGAALNPVVVAFGLATEPWIYFVNASGVVADRFEGPVTLEQLQQAADGTLAGRVPAAAPGS